MQALHKQVGERIRVLREKRGISQEALAAICGLHRTYIGLIERGERNLSLAAVETVANGLEVPVSEIFQDFQDAMPGPRSRPHKIRKRPERDIHAELVAIRRILIDAKLTDSKRYDALVKASSKKQA